MEVKERSTNKKRILYFVPEFPRLTETFIHREIDKLIERGNIDVHVFSLARATGKMSERVASVTSYERINIGTCISAFFSYILLDFRKFSSLFSLIGGRDKVPYLFPLVGTANQIEGKTSLLGRFSLSRLVILFKALAYAKLFAKYTPDHIHVHFLSSPSTLAMIAAKVLNVPFSISAHAKDVFVDGTLIQTKAKQSKFITVCNGNTWAEVQKLAGKDFFDNKIYKVFHGVDIEKDLAAIRKEPSTIPRVVTIARLVEKKGLRYLIETSKVLKDRGISHRIDIIGPGPMYSEFTKLINELELSNFVIIHGEGKGLPFEQTLPFLKNADIFVLPNIETTDGDVDGVPTAIIEAALARLPIVTTYAGSVSDLITDQQTGIIVPQKDSSVLATVIEKLIYSPDLRVELGNNAYVKAKELFDIDRNVKELEELLLS